MDWTLSRTASILSLSPVTSHTRSRIRAGGTPVRTRFSDAVNSVTLGRWLSVSAVGAAAIVWGTVGISGQDDPLLKTEPLAGVIQRNQKEKPTFERRQQDLLALRYDLANRAAQGV